MGHGVALVPAYTGKSHYEWCGIWMAVGYG
jgi:hypothetical protein